MRTAAILTAFILGIAVSGCDHAHDHGDHDHGKGHEENAEPASATPDDGYPLKTCVVSGEQLGSMGKPKVVTHEGQTVKLCCAGCEKDFKKDPAKYVKMVQEAARKP